MRTFLTTYKVLYIGEVGLKDPDLLKYSFVQKMLELIFFQYASFHFFSGHQYFKLLLIPHLVLQFFLLADLIGIFFGTHQF